jgi:predicted transcriptional regulator
MTTKKLFSISQPLCIKLEEIAKNHRTTQSRIIESALTIYLLMETANKSNTKKIDKIVRTNQELLLTEIEKLKSVK